MRFPQVPVKHYCKKKAIAACLGQNAREEGWENGFNAMPPAHLPFPVLIAKKQ